MVTSLRDAKSRFSELVRLAAGGEDVLITVRGEPMAKLTGVGLAIGQGEGTEEWIDELAAAAEREAVGDSVATSQSYWDESRGDR